MEGPPPIEVPASPASPSSASPSSTTVSFSLGSGHTLTTLVLLLLAVVGRWRERL